MERAMKSWWVRDEPGGAVIEQRDVPVPDPGPGELRLRLHAAALNRGEFLRSPSYAASAAARPAGADCSGEVDAVGEGVTGWNPGQRAMGAARGAYAEYALIDHRLASPVPDRLSWEEAAAVPIVFQVAHDMLRTEGHLAAGRWLLVTGISSGVGVACLQEAKMIGARVIGTSRSRTKLERLKELGLDVAIESSAGDFCAAVLAATGNQGVDLVVNNIGGSVFAECVRCMGYGARLATVGYLDRNFSAVLDLNALHSRRLHVFGVSARYRPVAERAEGLRRLQSELLPAFADGRIRPLVDRVFALDELREARTYMESDRHIGKIVLSIAQPGLR